MKRNLVILSSFLSGLLILSSCSSTKDSEVKLIPDTLVVTDLHQSTPYRYEAQGGIGNAAIYEVIKTKENPAFSMAYVILPEKEKLLLRSLTCSETIIVLEGSGLLKVDGVAQVLKPMVVVQIPPGAKQTTLNDTKDILKYVSICCPPWTPASETLYEKPQPQDPSKVPIATEEGKKLNPKNMPGNKVQTLDDKKPKKDTTSGETPEEISKNLFAPTNDEKKLVRLKPMTRAAAQEQKSDDEIELVTEQVFPDKPTTIGKTYTNKEKQGLTPDEKREPQGRKDEDM